MIQRSVPTILLVVFAGFIFAGAAICAGSSEKEKVGALGLLSIGEPGSEATPIKAWLVRDDPESSDQGDSVVVLVQAKGDGYLTIVAVSSEGRASVLLPNKEMKDTKNITMRNGKPATQGVCSSCGTKMFKIGKS